MIVVAGAGPGNPKYLTMDVREKIGDMECVLAFGRISETLKPLRKDIVSVSRVSQVLDYIKANQGRDILLLASGDPTFYGIINYLKRNDVEIKSVLPGLSSFQYMMAKLEEPWQNANLFSLHGREDSLDRVREYELSICLTDSLNTPSKISHDLKEIGIRGRLYVGYNLSYDNENIVEVEIGQDLDDISSLAIVVIKNEMD